MTWFWILWGVSSFLCVIINSIINIAVRKIMHRKHPDWRYKKTSVSEKIVLFLRAFILCLIPFINILFVIGHLFACTSEKYLSIVEKNLEKQQ